MRQVQVSRCDTRVPSYVFKYQLNSFRFQTGLSQSSTSSSSLLGCLSPELFVAQFNVSFGDLGVERDLKSFPSYPRLYYIAK